MENLGAMGKMVSLGALTDICMIYIIKAYYKDDKYLMQKVEEMESIIKEKS